MAAPLTHALEWRIAWRHLRVGETHPRWVDVLTLIAVVMVLMGLLFVLWAAHLGPAPAPGEQLFSAAVATAQQRQFGVFGGLSISLGVMLGVVALLTRYFNLLATIITMSVLLGCMALVVVLSLMSGLEVDLRDKILNQKAHIRVSAANGNRFTDYEELAEVIAALPEVAGASPYLEAEVMVRSGINRQGAVLLGVEPERLLTVSNLADIMREGSFDALSNPRGIPDPNPFGQLEPETPWRLRHLDKDKSKNRRSDSIEVTPKFTPPLKFQQPSSDGMDSKLDDLQDSFDFGRPGDGGEPEEATPIEGQPEGLNQGRPAPLPTSPIGKLSPPLPELIGGPGGLPGPFGPAGLPGFDDDDGGGDDGWEDPMEVLGIEEEGGDDGWETEGGQPDPEEGAPEQGESSESEALIDPILLGRELASELAVGVGARVQLITPVGRLTPAGRVPGILATKVGGVFHSGMYEYDRKNVYMPLSVTQAFLRTGDRITGIEVKLRDVDAIDEGKRAVEAVLRDRGRSAPYLQRTVSALVEALDDEALRAEFSERYSVSEAESQLIVETWKELNQNLFSAMFLEKIAMFVALMFVVLVASFGILASNLMSVLEKSKEIAILKAMGAQDQLIQRVFVAEGLVLGLLGAVGGISVGLALCWALDTFGFPFNENVYYIERLPVVVNPFEVAIVGAAALVIVWLSSLYPARVASRMRPIDGLRQQEK